MLKTLINPEPVYVIVSVRCFVLLTMLSFSGQLIAGEPMGQNAQDRVVFHAMGDVPYVPAEDLLLPRQIAELPGNADFVVHVGDIKGGAPPCHEAVYEKVSGILSKAESPVFIIPGDNEWNDCIDPNQDQAWTYWERHFMRLDRRWKHDIPVFRQLEREENFSFVKNRVLFVGINLVGGCVHDAAEWKLRHAENLNWIRRNINQFGTGIDSLVIFGHARPVAAHRDFFAPFQKDALDLGKPILYLHGDGHRWVHDRPFKAKNILRVQVDQGGIASPVRVTVTDHLTEPFIFDRGVLP